MYCAHCGNPLPEAEAIAEVAAEAHADTVSAEVEIARINAERDITLAKIAAKAADAEMVTDLAVAEAVAETLEEVISPEPAEPVDQAPVVIVDAPEAEAVSDDQPEEFPEAEPLSEPKESKPSYGSKGWFG